MSAATPRTIRRHRLRRGAVALGAVAALGLAAAAPAAADPIAPQGVATGSWVSEGAGYNNMLDGQATVVQNLSIEGGSPVGTFCIQYGVTFLPGTPGPEWEGVTWEAFAWDVDSPTTIEANLAQAAWIAEQYNAGNPVVAAFDPTAQFLGYTDYSTTGTYQIDFAGHVTAPIAVDADGPDVQAALEALPNVGAGNVTVTDSVVDDGQMVVTFDPSVTDRTTALVVTDSFDVGDIAVTPNFGAPANASAAQLAIWAVVNGTDITGAVNAEILAQANAIVAAVGAVAPGDLPSPGTIGYNVDIDVVTVGAQHKAVVSLSRIDGADASVEPLAGEAANLTVTIDGVTVPVTEADDPTTTDAFEYETELRPNPSPAANTSETVEAAVSFTGVIDAGARVRSADPNVTAQESMLIADAAVTRTATASEVFAGPQDEEPPADTTPPTMAPPADPTPTPELPYTGGWVSLPVLLAGTAVGAAGLWLRRRPTDA